MLKSLAPTFHLELNEGEPLGIPPVCQLNNINTNAKAKQIELN